MPIFRWKDTFEAFQYNGQFSKNCPEWARTYVSGVIREKRQNELMGWWLIKSLTGECKAFPDAAFRELYEEVEDNKSIPSEGQEDFNDPEPLVA